MDEWKSIAEEGVNDALSALARLYKNEELSDLTVICGSKTFKVHKALVCERSEFFRRACLKGAFKEGESNVIVPQAARQRPSEKGVSSSRDGLGERHLDDISADDPDAVGLMIYYFYHLDYQNNGAMSLYRSPQPDPTPPPKRRRLNSGSKKPTPTKPPATNQDAMSLLLHANVFAVATKYAVSGLPTLATLYFKQKLQELCNSQSHETTGAEPGEAIRVVFSKTPDNVTDLREPVREALLDPNTGLLELAEVGTAVDSIDGLALDLLRRCGRQLMHRAMLKRLA